MTFDEVKMWFKEIYSVYYRANKDNSVYASEAISMAIKALEAQRWIPVSERLPEKRTSILVYHSISGLTDEAWFFKHIRHPLHEDDIDVQDQYWSDVTHWMPLPEPPQGV